MKQIFKINYRSIVIFELIYRLIYVVLFQSISVRCINFLLDVYGFSYLNIKNIKGLLLNPLTYLNCSPSSRQLKKYKIFLASRDYLLAVFMRLPNKFHVFP